MSETDIQPHAQHGLQRQVGLGDLVLAQILRLVGRPWVGAAAGLGCTQAFLAWRYARVLPAIQRANSIG